MINDLTEGFGAYKTYLALKSHFSTSYDFFKYNGKVKVNEQSFLKRNDRFFFRRVQKKHKNEIVDFFVANIVSGKNWVGDFNDESFEKWKRIQDSLSYSYTNDLRVLMDHADKVGISFVQLLDASSGQHPSLLKRYLGRDISLETMVIFNSVVPFRKNWNKHLENDVIWPDVSKLMAKYAPFMSIDSGQLEKFKKITKETVL